MLLSVFSEGLFSFGTSAGSLGTAALPFGRSGGFANDCAVHHLTTPRAWIWDRSRTAPSLLLLGPGGRGAQVLTESFRDLSFGATCYLLQNRLDRLNTPPFLPARMAPLSREGSSTSPVWSCAVLTEGYKNGWAPTAHVDPSPLAFNHPQHDGLTPPPILLLPSYARHLPIGCQSSHWCGPPKHHQQPRLHRQSKDS
jgi:hypothetical protein